MKENKNREEECTSERVTEVTEEEGARLQRFVGLQYTLLFSWTIKNTKSIEKTASVQELTRIILSLILFAKNYR